MLSVVSIKGDEKLASKVASIFFRCDSEIPQWEVAPARTL